MIEEQINNRDIKERFKMYKFVFFYKFIQIEENFFIFLELNHNLKQLILS